MEAPFLPPVSANLLVSVVGLRPSAPSFPICSARRDVRDYLTACGCQIGCYRGAHATEADKLNMALQRRTRARRGARSLPIRNRTERPGGDEG